MKFQSRSVLHQLIEVLRGTDFQKFSTTQPTLKFALNHKNYHYYHWNRTQMSNNSGSAFIIKVATI